MTVVAFVPDLMDRSRLGGRVTFGRTVEEAEGASLAVVDLSRPNALDLVRSLSAAGVRTVGFGSHVDRELLAAAQEAGCDQVLARSQFFSRLDELLG